MKKLISATLSLLLPICLLSSCASAGGEGTTAANAPEETTAHTIVISEATTDNIPVNVTEDVQTTDISEANETNSSLG